MKLTHAVKTAFTLQLHRQSGRIGITAPAPTISRYLLGLVFLVFGLNGFLHFIPQPPMPDGLANQYMNVMVASQYFVLVFVIQVVCAALFLSNQYVPLAPTLIAPVIVNILLFNGLMLPTGLPIALIVTALWFVLFYWNRAAFAGILQNRQPGSLI